MTSPHTTPRARESTFAILLRDPERAVHACLSGEGRRELARTALLSFFIGALLFGGVVGAFRGDMQLIFAAIKMPLLLLGAMVTTVPAVWALGATEERAWPMRAAGSLMLVAAGRAALVLAALAPLLWLATDLVGGYHLSAFLAAAALGISGIASLSVLLRGMRGMPWGIARARGMRLWIEPSSLRLGASPMACATGQSGDCLCAHGAWRRRPRLAGHERSARHARPSGI